MPCGALGPDLLRQSPERATFQAPPSVAEERGWPAEGTTVPTAKTNDPDGSPLKSWYLPCGMFLPSRTFPSGPLPTVSVTQLERKPESQFAANPPSVAKTSGTA